MSTPPAFTVIQTNFVNEFLAKEIATKRARSSNASKSLKNNLLLRLSFPPFAIWAVLYCLVEYLI